MNLEKNIIGKQCVYSYAAFSNCIQIRNLCSILQIECPFCNCYENAGGWIGEDNFEIASKVCKHYQT